MRPATLLLAVVCLSTVAAPAEEISPVNKAPSGDGIVSQPLADGTSPELKVDEQRATPEYSLHFNAQHPGDTALSQDKHGEWRFRSFPGLATLYVYDKDTPGKSNCGAPCTSAWAPLLASSTESSAVGDWTLIARPDGRHQWAYKGHPVYLRYHDLAADIGNIQRQGFRRLEP